MNSIKDLVFEKLHSFYKAGLYCDVRINLGDNFVSAHSLILSAISTLVISKHEEPHGILFNFDIKGNSQLKCYLCLNAIMEFVYGKNISLDNSHIPHVRFIMNSLCIIPSFIDTFIDIAMGYQTTNSRDAIKQNISVEHNPHNDVENNDEINSHVLGEKEPDILVKPKFSTNKCDEIMNVCILDLDKNTDPSIILKINATPLNKPDILKSDVTVGIEKSSRLQSCLECGYQCYKPSDLLVHVQTSNHQGNICSLCLSKFDSNKILHDHLSKHNHPKPFYCVTCEQRFQTRALLGQHLPKHSSETPYACPHCKKGFKWKHGLNSHLIVHTKEKKHLCDECGYSTTHAKTLRAHKLMHTGNLFRCAFAGCTHTSVRKENMKIHQATHCNERPFVCEICGLKFTQSKNLKRHSLIHEQNSPKIQLCSHCTFTTNRTDKLRTHILKQHPHMPVEVTIEEFEVPLMNEVVERTSDDFCFENDLSVLADAASSRIKIDNLQLLSETKKDTMIF